MKSIAFGIIVILLFILLIILFCAVTIKLYIKKVKEHNQKELDFQKKLTQTVIETQEQALQNIARELHDDAGQQITVINFQLENLKLNSLQQEKSLEYISGAVQQLGHTLRNLSHSLNHSFIFQNDLLSALENECKRINALNRLNCKIIIEQPFTYRFTDDEKIVLFRIFQEITANAIKHSQATDFYLKIRQDTTIKIEFHDNGKGFDTKKVNPAKTNGLQNIIERCSWIGWEMIIKSTINKGTDIVLSKVISVFPNSD